MPFVYEFKLNQSKLYNVQMGFTTNRLWEEALDDGTITLKFQTDATPKTMYGLFQIDIYEIDNYIDRNEINSKHFDFLIYSDNIRASSHYGYYEHVLSVIEYTAKLDTYFVASLAKSFSIKQNYLAPFKSYFNQNLTNNEFSLGAILPNVYINKTYYTETETTFDEVDKAHISITGVTPNYRLADVYISTNAPLISGSNMHNLTNHSATWVFPQGKWEISLGFIYNATTDAGYQAVDNGEFQPVYTYYINVIEKNDLTIYDIVNEIRTCVSRYGGLEDVRYFENTRIFDIDENVADYLKTVKAPQTFLSNATARQMLIYTLQFVNALPRLEWNDGVDILNVEYFNLPTGAYEEKDIIRINGQQNINQIGTRSVSIVKQSLPNQFEEPTTYIGSLSGKVQVRATNNDQITQDTFELKLVDGKPLYIPTKFEIDIDNVVLTGKDSSGGDTINLGKVTLDLMPRFINQDEWLLKNITTDFPNIETKDIFEQDLGMRLNRVSNLSWKMGDTSISLSNIYGSVFKSNLIENVVVEALREYITINPPLSINASNRVINQWTLSYDIPAYKDWRIHFEYISDETLFIKQDKEDLSQINFYSEMRQNQEEAFVNIQRQSQKTYGSLQRAGNVGYSFSKIHHKLSEAYQIGQKDVNNFTITSIRTQWFNDFYINQYDITKHHNRIGQATRIEQHYRPFDNFAKNVLDRHEHYSDYLIIVPPNTTISQSSDKIYSNRTVKIAMGILLGSDSGLSNTEATVALIRTDGMMEVYTDEYLTSRYFISTPISSFGQRGALSFTFGFNSNQVAGNQLVQRGSQYYNKAVRYTDEYGKFTKFGFWILRDISFDNIEYNYPLIKRNPYTVLNNQDLQYFGCSSVSDDGSLLPLIVNKDPLTNFKLTYQMPILSHQVNLYVFGLSFFSNNYLVSNPKDNQFALIYIYQDGTTYEYLTDNLVIKSGYSDVYALHSDYVSFNETTLEYRFLDIVLDKIQESETTSWAIGNQNGDLYIACNDSLEGFDVKTTHIRPGIYEIGKYKVVPINIVIDFIDTFEIDSIITVEGPTSFVVSFIDNYVVTSTFNIEKSTDYIIQLEDDYDIVSTINVDKSTDYIIELIDDYDIETAMTVNKSTNISILLKDDFNISSTINVNKSTNIQTILQDNLVINTTINFERSFRWVLTTDTDYDYTLTYATTGTVCASSETIKAWLTTNHNPNNYSLGEIVRVIRNSNIGEVICSPQFYYYVVETS